MNSKKEELKEKVKELNKMQEQSFEDIEQEPITELDKKIVKKYQEIWKEVLKICKEEKIKETEIFDEKYDIFQWGLEDFIDSYTDFVDYCAQMDEIYLEPEVKILKEAIEQFDLNTERKQEYELLIIRDTYIMGNKKEAQKQIDEWIKKNPTQGEGYEVKCDWELEKAKPNMEKIAKILDEAEENGTYVPNEEIYEEVIEYFEEVGNDEMADYYSSLLDFIEEDNYYYEDDFEEEYEENLNEEREEVIEIINEMANDKVKKNKTFEQYLDEKNDMECNAFLVPQIFMKTAEEMEKTQENTKKYILENYDTILKENIKYLPENIIKLIKDMLETGWKEIDLEEFKTANELLKMQEYFMLKQFGMAFIESKNEKLIIAVPKIKKMKEYLKDKELMKENQKINEMMNIIKGMCEVYGAIKTRKIHHILEEFYGKIDKNELAKYLLMFCTGFGIAGLKMDKSTGSLQYIYNNMIEENEAKKIIKENKELKKYIKEEYINYSSPDFLRNTKGYKLLEKEFYLGTELENQMVEMLQEILIPYTIQRRLGTSIADEMLKMMTEQVEEINMIMDTGINVKNIKKAFKQLDEELPRW